MREKFKRFCDTANPDLLRLVIIFVLVGLLLAGFLLFGRSGNENSVMPAWEQAEHVDVENTFHIIESHIGYGNMLGNTGIVDENIKGAVLFADQRKQFFTVFHFSHISEKGGTNIDAPVQQYGDNDYYLRRDENGSEDYHGCIYADYACRMDSSVKVSRNLIFYGHTFTDEDYTGGFEDLHKYRVFEFGQENPYIYVSLADEKLGY